MQPDSTAYTSPISPRVSWVRVMAALALVAFVDHAKSSITELAPHSNDIDTVLTLLGVGELLPGTTVAENYCDADIPLVDVCYNIIFFLIVGPDTSELNKVKLLRGGGGNFAKYDYGLLDNLNHYGQQTPPHYDLARVTASVGLFHSDDDWLAGPELLEPTVVSHCRFS
ncbi:Lipase 3 [Portunus trituberculatus]|uniref:Lipase 3 n=1 Tax=Portunus trituberculatus TaxID=210409 RepID=A0A5B7EZ83_PORTR|nr:Lipase 3 [Portunus trituberculatus]